MFARCIDAARLKETTPEALLRGFDTVRDTLLEYGIRPKNVYNMDETGFAVGSTRARRVLIDARARIGFKAQPGCQEWVTVIECTSVNSTVIPLCYFQRGEYLDGMANPSGVY